MIENCPIDYCPDQFTGAYVEEENTTSDDERSSTNSENIDVYISDEFIINL